MTGVLLPASCRRHSERLAPPRWLVAVKASVTAWAAAACEVEIERERERERERETDREREQREAGRGRETASSVMMAPVSSLR